MAFLPGTLPGTLTEQAKFNRPFRDCTSLRMAFLRCKNSIRGGKHLLSLSGAKGVSISTECNAIPASDVVVKGPKVFFCFNGDVNIGAKIDKQI